QLPEAVYPAGTTRNGSGPSSRRADTGLRLLPRNFFQHAHRGAELRVKITAQDVEHLNQCMVADRIENLIAHLSVNNDLFGAKNSQVLGSISLLHPEFLDELACRHLAISQQFDDGNPGRIGESLENLTLELAQRISHLNIVYSNC